MIGWEVSEGEEACNDSAKGCEVQQGRGRRRGKEDGEEV